MDGWAADALDAVIAAVWQANTRVFLHPDQATIREWADRDGESPIDYYWSRRQALAIMNVLPKPPAYEIVAHPERRDRWQVQTRRVTRHGGVECVAYGSWRDGLDFLLLQPEGWQPWPGYYDDVEVSGVDDSSYDR